MEIEKGFGRFTTGETLNVEILGVWYTKNGKQCLRMKSEDEKIFSNNIPDMYKNLRGRCTLTCTGVSDTGFPYIELKKMQDSSWDAHDKVSDELSTVIDTVQDEVIDELLEDIELTIQYQKRVTHPRVIQKIEDILQILYEEYGRRQIESQKMMMESLGEI